ncbi:MAG: hypothetical protein BGO54_16915 [Sphingobacteriales bacterium 46-32]|nr:MAG: hypothetical protein BGO54_16915 [Sphingobacteriales bacterium 46-32]
MDSSSTILQDSVALWVFLKNNAGMDSVFYDQFLLDGEVGAPGLYFNLGIPKGRNGFERDLLQHGIGSERLLVAFFKTLQPFSQLMSELCVFFEKHKIKETGSSLKVVFDFDKAAGAGLEFDLKHFRQTLEKLTKAKMLLGYYHLTNNHFWPLIHVFQDKLVGKTAANPTVRRWVDGYKNNAQRISEPSIETPVTGNVKLDNGLSRIMVLWRNYIEACRRLGDTHEQFRKKMSELLDIKDDCQTANEAVAPWDATDLYYSESDFWPGTFLDMMFLTLEDIEVLPDIERQKEYEQLGKKLEMYLNTLPIQQHETDVFLKELIDLLNLPVWKRRYELYAAWVLTLIDKSFTSMSTVFHSVDEKLILSFRATHLATVDAGGESLELWSEVRSPVHQPSGKGRKENVQPDYSLFVGADHLPDRCLAAVEVKQYRTPSINNFSNALNDYTKALPNAHVFLVNYGGIPGALPSRLNQPERSFYFGQIKPASTVVDKFINALKARLPASGPIPFENFSNLYIDELFVDISQSLNNREYKEFLQTFLTDKINKGQVGRLIAVDTDIRGDWNKPTVKNVEEMLLFSFSGSTDFVRFITPNFKGLVITDQDGVSDIKEAGISIQVIEFPKDKKLCVRN